MKVFSLSHVQAGSLREKIQAALSDKATVTLDEHANQIVISDFNDNLRVVGELIAALDTDRPAGCRRARAAVETHGRGGSGQGTGAAVPENERQSAGQFHRCGRGRTLELADHSFERSRITTRLERIITALDTADAQEKVRKTFVLKNADAQDVAKQLQDLGQDQDNNNRYPYYYYYDSGSSSTRPARK